MNKYKEDNGFLPIMIEIGKTITMREESNWVVGDVMYQIFQKVGVEAVLCDTTELGDTEQYFMKRLNFPIAHVVSNLYPKDAASPFARLKQSYSKTLPNGSKVFFINLMNPDNFQNQVLITKNYDIIQPAEFLRKFTPQISPRDVLVARLNLNTNQLTDLFRAPEANRIDMVLMPNSEARNYLSDTERELVQSISGWTPASKTDETQQAPPLAPSPLRIQKPQGFVGPPAPSDTPASPGASKTGDSTKSENGSSANQGGEKTQGAGDTNPASGVITTPGTAPNPSGQELPPSTQQTPQAVNPLPPPNIDLKVDDRQYMDIVNEHHVVPEVQSAEYLREVVFQRTRRGDKEIKVSDIIMYENVPHDPEIKKWADETDIRQQEVRTRNTTLRIAGNFAEGQRSYLENKNPYVGPQACKECHEIAYKVWESSTHAKALDGLKKKSATKNETCLKCHVTTWDPPTGWGGQEWQFGQFAPELGCEACHGPGASHIALLDYMIQSDHRKYWSDVKTKYPYLGLKGPLSKVDCLKCHDKANSPNFDFVKYWDKIIHNEPDIVDLPQPKTPPVPQGGAITNAAPGGMIPGSNNPLPNKGGQEKPGEKKPDKKKPDTKKPDSGKSGSKDSGGKKSK